jgi:ParB family chromosome partitioning protein
MGENLARRKVTPLNEFFGAKNSHGSGNGPVMLKIAQCVPFEGHPFKLYEGIKLDDMAESIKENGVMVPIVVRPIERQIEVGGVMLPLFEILIGHNRVHGSKIAGLDEVPTYIREGLSDAEARILVVESNLMQRSMADMLPSELARAYKMQLEAYKETGKKQEFLKEIQEASNACADWDTDRSAQSEQRQWSVEKVADDNKSSRANIQRYIRLNYLIEPLFGMVDDGKIGFMPAVNLSFLKEDEQYGVLKCMETNGLLIDVTKANALHSYSKSGTLTAERIYTVLSGVIKKPGRPAAVKVSPKVISKYFTQEQKQAEIDEIVGKALERWFAERGRT